MRKYNIAVVLTLFIVTLVLLINCSMDYVGEEKPNQPPFIILANSPPDSATVAQAPIFWWYAPDVDGYATLYKWADFSINLEPNFRQYENNPNLIPDSCWVTVESTYADTIFLSHDTVDFNMGRATEHLFCIKAIDDDTAESEITCITIYRTNIPPVNMEILAFPFERYSDWDEAGLLEEAMWDSMNYDTLWSLKYTTYSWQGINFVWDAEDPDDPVIMEFYWYIIDQETGEIAQCSEDSRYHDFDDGIDTLDGWITSSSVTITGLGSERRPADIGGSYIFYVKARDDAFYESDPDSAPLTIVTPEIDLSDSLVVEEWVNEGIDLKILLVDATGTGVGPGIWEPYESEVHEFYENMFAQFKNDNVIFDYNTVDAPNTNFPGQAPSWSSWRISMADLASNNIVYWYDVNATDRYAGITPRVAERLGRYVEIGGRLIIDGRKCLGPAVADNDYYSFAYQYLGLCAGGLCFSGSYAWANWNEEYFKGAISRFPLEYPDLYPDPDKDLGTVPGLVPGVGRLFPRQPAYGMPCARIIYTFDCDTGAGVYEAYQGDGVAIEFITPSFRTVYFEVPLYLMENEDNDADGTPDVEQTMKQAFKFIQTPPYVEEEEDQTRF
ncbi:hypothetical protein JXI42_14270 [bacterium]|nr:hypothetical protein [bacterium]